MSPVRPFQQAFWRGKAMEIVEIILKTIKTNLEV